MSAASADLPPVAATTMRRERRRERKKQRRRRTRREAAALARAAAEALAVDPEEERRLRKLQEAEAVASECARRAFEDAQAAAAQEEATAPEASSCEKAEKLLARNLPFPYTSKDVYEQSIRMPIGPDFNPAISVSALNRPAIVKKPGVIIKPIQYEEVDPHEKPDEPKRVIQRAAPNPKAKKSSAKQAKGTTSHKKKRK